MQQDNILQAELNELLGEDISAAKEREKTAFNRLVEPFKKSLVLFGAGNLGRQVLARLRQDGIEPLAFADNNPALHGKSIEGLPVLSPKQAAKKYGSKAAFVVTIWTTGHAFVQTRQQLLALGCKKIVSAVVLRWKYPESFLPFFWLDLPSKSLVNKDLIKSAFSLWADEFSRQEYLAQLKFRILGEFDLLSAPVQQESYFPNDIFTLRADESFVDCGAFDGITIRQFLKRQTSFRGRITAYEPDPDNFENLQKYASSLPSNLKERLIILPYAVGRQRAKVRFNATGTMGSSINTAGSLEVDCVTLDEDLHKLSFTPTYIKMDIEGGELDALAGSREIIQKDAPVLAICLYHRYDDLWQIPLYINTLSSQYRLFLRPHEIEGWQLVCYAIPKNRLIP